jgi:Tol biopolymer transport system component
MRMARRNDRTPGLPWPGGSRAPLRPAVLSGILSIILIVLDSPAAGAATDGITTPLPAASRGTRTSFSFRPWLSADGRFLAFDSDSTTLVPGDTNGARDIFVHDVATGATTRVSVGLNGAQANGDSQRPSLSADGRYVAFWSAATNLVEGDTNKVPDAFVYDRQTNKTTRVSVRSDGAQANGESARPVLSADGKAVAFESAATNLTPPTLLRQPTDSNGVRDVFVHELESGKTERVSVGSDGAQGTGESVRPSISADGNVVTFHTDSVFDKADTNTARDVYVRDRSAGTTALVSLGGGGEVGNGGSFSPSISADGRYVAFWSNASNFVGGDTNAAGDVFVRDLAGRKTERVSVASDGHEGNGPSSDASISPDGRYVAFWSAASNLVEGDSDRVRDVFLHDSATGGTVRVSVASDGTQPNADCFSPNVSSVPGMVAFDSEASTLVKGDTNKGSDIFLHTDSPPAAPPPGPAAPAAR